jgi:hypothetical protein
MAVKQRKEKGYGKSLALLLTPLVALLLTNTPSLCNTKKKRVVHFRQIDLKSGEE